MIDIKVFSFIWFQAIIWKVLEWSIDFICLNQKVI